MKGLLTRCKREGCALGVPADYTRWAAVSAQGKGASMWIGFRRYALPGESGKSASGVDAVSATVALQNVDGMLPAKLRGERTPSSSFTVRV